jgi:hypothetical protein
MRLALLGSIRLQEIINVHIVGTAVAPCDVRIVARSTKNVFFTAVYAPANNKHVLLAIRTAVTLPFGHDQILSGSLTIFTCIESQRQ